MLKANITRRAALSLLGGVALIPAAYSLGIAQEPKNNAARLIVVSDLHSAYERSAQLLASIRRQIESSSAPSIILINGDVFEIGNVVTARSDAIIDWALLEGFAKIAPTYLNIGNHEADLTNDMSATIARLNKLGIMVVSNMINRSDGLEYAPSHMTIALGSLKLDLVGIATNAITTYPKSVREHIDVPSPQDWVAENISKTLIDGHVPLILSHAGVIADKTILSLIPKGAILIGGHDHLNFEHRENDKLYLHVGSWSVGYKIIDIDTKGIAEVSAVSIALNDEVDEALASLIARTIDLYLTEDEHAVIGKTQNGMSMGQSARFVAETMAAAVGADVGFIGHTTFGTGYAKGEISRYDFDAVVRFDGKLMTTEVSAPVLAEILALTNQDGNIPLAKRTGDFLYSAPEQLVKKDTYRLVTNDWSAMNQKAYFGREDLVFVASEQNSIKKLMLDALH